MPEVARTVELKSRASSVDAVAEWLLGAMRQSAEPPGLKAMFAGMDAADERRFVLVTSSLTPRPWPPTLRDSRRRWTLSARHFQGIR